MLPAFDNTEIAFRYRSTAELKKAQLLFGAMSSQAMVNLGMSLTRFALNWRLPIKGIVKSTIFSQFCGGETLPEAAQTAERINTYNVGVILDYGVEGKEGEAEFDNAVPEFIKAIKYAASRQDIPFISMKVTGFARFALLEKIHAGQTLTHEENVEWEKVKVRIDNICSAAAENNVMVLIDAEETWIQNPVDELANISMEKHNKGKALIFNTFQLYTTRALPYLKESYRLAEEKGYILGAKLVRGAYMEKERKRAEDMAYPSPIQPDKAATDKDYNDAVHFTLSRLSGCASFIGTHNEHSCLEAARYMTENGIAPANDRVWFSQLFGMSDNISFNLADSGYNVAKYLPYGPVKEVLPYLMRRAQENTSVGGQTGRELALINKELKRRKAEK